MKIILLLCFFMNLTVFAEELYPFIKGVKTRIKDPFELRDPFREVIVAKQKKKKSVKKEGKGNYSNIAEIGVISLNRLRVVGVLLGTERRAMVKIAEEDGSFKSKKQVFILKEGMLLGPDKAELKAILPGGIVIVEKIINVYEQEEYIETIIPVTSE